MVPEGFAPEDLQQLLMYHARKGQFKKKSSSATINLL